MAILASGPSMTREQAEFVRGKCRVIAINNQGIDTPDDKGQIVPAFAPWADVLYGADHKWWDAYKHLAFKFSGLRVTLQDGNFPQLNYMQQSVEPVFDKRPTHLVSGGNSGYQAIHLAVHFGATRILLLGYDMRKVGGRKHWFGNHKGNLNSGHAFHVWIRNLNNFAPRLQQLGVSVVNCTPGSALKCFPEAKLTDVLETACA